jgi:hypothetical protein
MHSLYPGKTELDFFTSWLLSYNSNIWASGYFVVNPVRYEVFKNLDRELSERENIDQVDLNWLYLYLGEMAYENKEADSMISYYKKINPDNLLNILRSKEFGNQVNNHSFRLVATALEGLANSGDFEEINRLLKPFNKVINRTSLYAYSAKELLSKKTNPEIAKRLLDSARVEFSRTGIEATFQPHRAQLAYANTLYNPEENLEESLRIIKNLERKNFAMQLILRSLGFHTNLYEAKSHIPENISDDDYALLLSEILYGYAEGKSDLNETWTEFQKGYPWFVSRFIFYIDESS